MLLLADIREKQCVTLVYKCMREGDFDKLMCKQNIFKIFNIPYIIVSVSISK